MAGNAKARELMSSVKEGTAAQDKNAYPYKVGGLP